MSIVIGLKKVFVIIILWFGWPIKGVDDGLFVGEDEGDNVQNIKSAPPSTYLYLIFFWDELTCSVTTGSQKNEDVIIL